MSKKFTIRPQGLPPKFSFDTLDEAYEAALKCAQDSGRNVAVIEHEGDTSRLVKKVVFLR